MVGRNGGCVGEAGRSGGSWGALACFLSNAHIERECCHRLVPG